MAAFDLATEGHADLELVLTQQSNISSRGILNATIGVMNATAGVAGF